MTIRQRCLYVLACVGFAVFGFHLGHTAGVGWIDANGISMLRTSGLNISGVVGAGAVGTHRE
jgi:hypothetical protein